MINQRKPRTSDAWHFIQADAASRRGLVQALDVMLRDLPIDEIEIDGALGIPARPRVTDVKNCDFIYRAAMGVRWHPQKRAFLAAL